MSVVSETKSVADKSGIAGKVKHCICFKCYPNLKPDDVVVAICGTERVVRDARRRKPPAEACVVCLDMQMSHHQSHLGIGT